MNFFKKNFSIKTNKINKLILQLPVDCLYEILGFLENDKGTLYSCLLVNRIWCQVSVRILWRNIWIFKYSLSPQRQQILSTLVACLPDESKDFLHKNGIFITTPTLKPPLFNYASFCKVLSTHEIDLIIQFGLEHHNPSIKYLVSQEILKMFMNKISSLKELDYRNPQDISDVIFTKFPGAIDSLTNLSVLNCSS